MTNSVMPAIFIDNLKCTLHEGENKYICIYFINT